MQGRLALGGDQAAVLLAFLRCVPVSGLGVGIRRDIGGVEVLEGGFAQRSGGGWLRLYRWVDGVPADLADAGAAVRIGGLLGRLHACALPPRFVRWAGGLLCQYRHQGT